MSFMKSFSKPGLNRRAFLGQASCAAIGSVSVLSTLWNLRLAGASASDSLAPGTDAKSLICVFLLGGNDSFNMLVPRGDGYLDYQVSRSNLAIPEQDLLPLDLAAPHQGLQFGLHPSCVEMQELFNGLGQDSSQRRLSFISNIGTLIHPMNVSDYLAERFPVPKSLFSHIDQTDQWQTALPQGSKQYVGWAGRAADVLHSAYNSGKVSMSISLSGNNLLLAGTNVHQFVITEDGSLSLTGPDTPSDPTNPLWIKNRSLRNIVEQRYAHLMQESFAQISRDSLQSQANFQTLYDNFNDTSIQSLFPSDNPLATKLRSVVKTIAIRKGLGLRRQTFFVGYAGWDHHYELLSTQQGMLRQLSQALWGLQNALEKLGLAQDVVTFTASDFGRTLRSNGRGTDHAWGGNTMVMGAPVQGGQIFGKYPSLQIGGPDDIGLGGRMLPTTSVDVYFCELMRWLGVSASNMSYVLPNIRNFFDPNSASAPLGFLKPSV